MNTNKITRILLIDDDTDLLIAMKMQLRGHYNILTAHCIDDGLRVLRDQEVDLVLLDVELGDESGIQGIGRIKEAYPSLSVAMLSGRCDEPTAIEAIRAGAKAYLTKPLCNAELASVVEQVIGDQAIN